ncbi:MAG: MIP/aquaporin family protein [Anaerolineae bacterium]
MFNWKVFLAEFIGTFALVFISAGAGVVQAGLVGMALAYGLTLMVFVYVYGHISGSHLNPAVTFGLALQGTLKWMDALVYWVAQFLGAISAAGLLHLVVNELGGTINAGATVGALTENFPLYAMLIEAVLTFLLVNAYLHTMAPGKDNAMAGLAIGMTLTAIFFIGGPLTGGSFNPARTLGTAIYAEPSLAELYTYVIYLFGPFIGSTLAVLLFNIFNTPEVQAIEEQQVPVKKPLFVNQLQNQKNRLVQT